ncbi:MAG: 16S rRNA (uracil(1498)-N(3))-methyltransferase [Candidatus Omnitrophica bacterium]|nr:16S rRNA (uracil(1498)-N(3))-methyltransferase [Candidatus Omnitrophota bacterium]
MNLILLSPSDFLPSSTTVRLTGRRHQHVLEIIKPKVNDVLVVGVENGRMGEGRIIKISDKILELEVVLSQDPPRKLNVLLCVALMRPIVLKRVLHTASAMGVPEIHLFHSRQVEKSFWQSTALKNDAIRDELILGLEQARDTVLPTVHFHKRFKPFVEDVLPELLKGRQGIVADPSGDLISTLNFQPSTSKVFIIGPEGGFIPYEVEKFRKVGCQIVSLGERILKVETAIVALLAKMF